MNGQAELSGEGAIEVLSETTIEDTFEISSDAPLTGENAQAMAHIVREMITPIIQSIGRMLEHNTRAMERIAAAQQMAADRIAALEREARLNTPMSARQAQYLNDAIRRRARELLEKRDLADDRKAVTKLAGAIRRSILSRFGASSTRDIPKAEYDVAMNQAGMWNDLPMIRDIMKEARARAAEVMDAAEPAAHRDD